MAFNMMTTTKIGTKGSDVYTANGVNDPRVALSVLLNRGCDEANVASGLDAILAKTSEDPQMLEDAFVLLFQTRDVRGGKGIRDASLMMEKHLLADPKYQSLMLDLLDLVPEYGSWRDLKMLALETKKALPYHTADVCDRVSQLFRDQLHRDWQLIGSGESLSLAAKYAPRECHECKEEKEFTKQLAQEMFQLEPKLSKRLRDYRKIVSQLNSELGTTEIKMCGQHFAEIEPAKVPGRCLQKNTKAFLNQPSTYKGKGGPLLRPSTDPDRVECAATFSSHFGKAAKGEAKLNGSKTVFPHELVKKVVGSMGRSYYEDEDGCGVPSSMTQEEKDAVVGVWNQMVKDAKAGGGLGRSLAMCDFSGSMQSSGTNGDTPYWVSMALGLLISEVTTKEFEDVFLTFDSTPKFHHLPKGDIFTRVASISGGLAQGTSTDFQKAMDLVLQRCKQMRVRPGEEPENLIVLTDMNWDQACGSHESSYYTGNSYRHHFKTAPWQTHVEMCRESFKRAGEDMWGEGNGWKMPTIVIWNIAATSGDFHAQADTDGVVMLSGWSPNLFKVLQTEGVVQWTPYQALRAQLDDERYNPVRARVKAWLQKRGVM
jgi:hypothetical protein